MVAAALVLGIFGCDDPEVQDKVENVLLHGVVEAELQCTGFQLHVCNSGWPLTIRAHKLIDGSSFVAITNDNGPVFTSHSLQFNSRDQGVSFNSKYGYENFTATIEDGVLSAETVCSSGGSPTDSVDLSTEPSPACSGRNLEAFGIEE